MFKNTLLALLLFSGPMAWSQWTVTNLPTARTRMGGVFADGKAYFAGGYTQIEPSYIVSAAVDIYNTGTGNWNSTQLSVPRAEVAAARVGSKLLFAGGSAPQAGGTTQYFNTVDVYDLGTGQWSQSSLPAARTGMHAVTIGNKAYFVGGHTNNAEDDIYVYDGTTGAWTSLALPGGARMNVGVAGVGTKIICAGGRNSAGTVTGLIEIFNTFTGSWATTNLILPRENTSGIGHGIYGFFVGGVSLGFETTFTDFFNNAVGTWGGTTLLFPRQNPSVCAFNGKIYVAGGDPGFGSLPYVEVYDTATEAWDSPFSLYFPNLESHSAQTALSTTTGILFAGGETNDIGFVEGKVFILPLGVSGTEPMTEKELKIWPTCAAHRITIETGTQEAPQSISIFDISGRPIAVDVTATNGNLLELNVSDLAPGTYLARIIAGGVTRSARFVKL